MADLVISSREYVDKLNAAITVVPLIMSIKVDYGSYFKEIICNSQDLILKYDGNANSFELSTFNNNFYRYTPSDTFNGSAVADAIAMFRNVRDQFSI